MRGYHSESYGDGFSDVYDDWYASVTDVGATVARMSSLVGSGGSVLELGVGTGRIAVPLADAGLEVTGIDSSVAMLDRLRARDPDGHVSIVRGDMVADLPAGPFDAALVAYNTIFNVLDAAGQAECFHAVAACLRPGGRFVVETYVPDTDAAAGAEVAVRSMTADRVVLSVTDSRPDEQRTDGQFIEITEAGGIRLRPWAVRWSTIEQLDAMAAGAGFVVEARHADMAGAPFTPDAPSQVTTYRRAPPPSG